MSGFWVKCLVFSMAIPALCFPAVSLTYILLKGLPALAAMAHDLYIPPTGGTENLSGPIVGSLLLMTGAVVLAAPIAFGVALGLQSQSRPRVFRCTTTLLFMLQGIPPIVYGLCGLTIFVYLLHWGVSLLSGVIILASVVLPTLSLNFYHALNRIPYEYTEAARALGLHEVAVILRVWLPLAWPGLVTGSFLALARTLAETAPILFTATVFSGVLWPDSWFSPVTTLQTHIFYMAQEGLNQRALDSAWAAAVALMGLIFLLSLLALRLRRRQIEP